MRPTAGIILRFLLAAAVGSVTVFALAAATQSGPTSAAVVGPAAIYADASPGDGAAAFGLVPDPPGSLVALESPPQEQPIQLTTFTGGQPAENTTPQWWQSGDHSRVPVITQFDGGPQQSTNCTLASGAMLARLGFGIVTTGSQLRKLQSKPTGGTTLGNLQEAVQAGWGIQFSTGALTRLEFRALIYAGAGAVLQGMYDRIPVDLRLQKNFTAAHSIYIDGFRPAAGGQPAAYWVNDPIGRTWAGYHGDWWPADVIEDFATALGGGYMLTAWAFAGGATPPDHYPVLPPDAYPSETPPPGPSASPSPTVTPTPSGSAGATASPTASHGHIPLPTGLRTPPHIPSGDDGPVVPADVPPLLKITASAGAALIAPTLGQCLAATKPSWCPSGIPVSVTPQGPGAVPSPGKWPVELLFAGAPQPGLVQVVFSATGSGATFQFWSTGAGGSVQPPQSLNAAVLGGKPVWIATFPVVAGGRYEFAAGTNGKGIGGISQIGVVNVGP